MKLAYCCSIYTWFIHKYCCLQMLRIGGSASFGAWNAFDYAGWCRTLLTPAACIALKHLRQHCCKQPNTQTQTPTNSNTHATLRQHCKLYCTVQYCPVYCVLCTLCYKHNALNMLPDFTQTNHAMHLFTQSVHRSKSNNVQHYSIDS